MRHIKNILLSIRDEESKVDLSPQHVIENSRYLACYLLKKHQVLKEYVLENGFSDINQEIEFFKKIKPEYRVNLFFIIRFSGLKQLVPSECGRFIKSIFQKNYRK